MKKAAVVADWARIPGRIRRAIAGLKGGGLKVRGGSEGWSVAEHVHHLVEANLIASHVVLAALGKPGCTYDWSWVTPDRGWMARLSYDRAPVEPALRLLTALTRHVASLVTLAPGAVEKHVELLDAPGKPTRPSTVAQILRAEVEHATHHLAHIDTTRRTGRSGALRRTGHGIVTRPRRKPR